MSISLCLSLSLTHSLYVFLSISCLFRSLSFCICTSFYLSLSYQFLSLNVSLSLSLSLSLSGFSTSFSYSKFYKVLLVLSLFHSYFTFFVSLIWLSLYLPFSSHHSQINIEKIVQRLSVRLNRFFDPPFDDLFLKLCNLIFECYFDRDFTWILKTPRSKVR